MEKKHEKLFRTQSNFFTEEHSWEEIKKLINDFKEKELSLFLKWQTLEEEVDETVASFASGTK